VGQHHGDVPSQQGEGQPDLTGAAGSQPGAAGPAPDRADEADADAREAGRLLFAAPWGFRRACRSMADLPTIGPPEFAFAGRSNVGKSSLINALTGRKSLAHASNTPGRTRALNLFSRDDLLDDAAGPGPTLVDMPGYGYARAPKAEVAAWTRLVFDYLRGRPSLRRVYLLVDARHGPKPVDLEAMKALDDAAVSYQVVLTKADKIGAAARRGVVAATADALRRRPAAHPDVLLTSAETGEGIADLRAAVAAVLAS
jgi:GTP-binding protein